MVTGSSETDAVVLDRAISRDEAADLHGETSGGARGDLPRGAEAAVRAIETRGSVSDVPVSRPSVVQSYRVWLSTGFRRMSIAPTTRPLALAF